MMAIQILVIAGTIIGIMGLLAVAAWASMLPSYMDCIRDDAVDDVDCLTGYLMLSPPMQEVEEIKDACDSSDTECLMKIGEKALTEKIGSYSKSGGDG